MPKDAPARTAPARKRAVKTSLAICAAIALVAAASLLCVQGMWRGPAKAQQGGGEPAVSAGSPAGVETRELWLANGDKRIYGVLYLPRGVERPPLTVIAHGLAGDSSYVAKCAESLAAHGHAAYAFDFCGGGAGSRSDGETTDMSIMTEADDLEAVLRTAHGWGFVDTSSISLLGESQGGVVASIVAGREPQLVSRLVLFYPAYSLIDDLHRQYKTLDRVPRRFNFHGWIELGRRYARDIWDFDFEREVGAYEEPVLVLHGSADEVVDPAYATRAAAAYDHAELHIIEGGTHGFSGAALDEAMRFTCRFLD